VGPGVGGDIRVAVQEGLPRLPGPRRGGGGGACRGGRVVEGAQHPRHIPQGEVGQTTLGEGAQRLALEVEQHPAAPGTVDDLTQVEVAVHALEGGPRRLGRGAEDGVDARLELAQTRYRGDGAGRAAVPLVEDLRALGGGGLLRSERRGQEAVHLGRRGTQPAGVERGSCRHAVECHPPRVPGPRDELLGNREIARFARPTARP